MADTMQLRSSISSHPSAIGHLVMLGWSRRISQGLHVGLLRTGVVIAHNDVYLSSYSRVHSYHRCITVQFCICQYVYEFIMQCWCLLIINCIFVIYLYSVATFPSGSQHWRWHYGEIISAPRYAAFLYPVAGDLLIFSGKFKINNIHIGKYCGTANLLTQ